MKKLTIFLFALFTGYITLGQAEIEKEPWTGTPAIHPIDQKYAGESAVILFDKRITEYTDEKDELVCYRTFHKIIHVNDDRGIESFNKVYLGVSDDGDIVDIRARTILPGGKIINLDKSNIRDQKDEDGSQYKIFALEGLEKGCEVEYVYTYKRPATYFGREVMQTGVPVLESQVQVICPKRLVYEVKTYHAVGSEQSLDTSKAEKRIVTVIQKNIPGAEEEKYSTYTSQLQRVEYKLSYNLSRSSNERLFTWNDLAKRVYEIYTSYTSKELKKVDEFNRDNGWEKLPAEKDKVIAVENYIKKNIATREDIDGDDAENIEKILKNRIASFRGIMRLYGAVFQQLGITFEFVLAGDRNDFPIDRDFEDWNNAQNPLIYFPQEKKFIAPTRIEMRYPWIHPYWAGTNGLFCRGTTIGNFTTAIGEIKKIPLESYTQTESNIDAAVQIDPVKDSLLIDIQQSHSGYEAAYYRASFTFSSAEEQRQILKDMVKFGTNSENVVSSKIENQDFESYSANKPFILKASVRANELMESAGNKILLKIGEVIGQQVEMYQEKPRQFPMDIGFPHRLERNIDLLIPAGYQVRNLHDLNMSKIHEDNGQVTMQFVSSYTREGNHVKIHVVEEYRQVTYPLAQYDDFKKIINAAADFNKIVLVLEKQGD